MSISIPAVLSCLLLLGSANAQVNAPNCTDNSYAWVGSFRRPSSIDNDTLFASCWCFCRRSTLSNKIPAGSWRTWHRHVITAVSRCTFGSSQTTLSACAAFTVPVLPPDQSYSGPSGADKGNTCKCNTVVYNLISACDACQGEPWTPCVNQLHFCLHSNQSIYLFTQLLSVVVQLYLCSDSRNVSPGRVSFPLTLVLSLPPQFPERGPSWHSSTQVGIYRHICAYIPLCPSLAFPGNLTNSNPQIGNNWNISTAQAAGGARSFCSVHTEIYSPSIVA
jgi:hypothetical protein